MATRMCGMEGRWDPVDMTPCTLVSLTTPPFIVVWLSLQDPSRVTLATQILTDVTNEVWLLWLVCMLLLLVVAVVIVVVVVVVVAVVAVV